MFELEDTTMDNFAKITVVGVGGGGINAVNNMIEQGLENVGFIAIDSDAETLLKSVVPKRVQIGEKMPGGQGPNGQSETSDGLAEESREDILEALRGAQTWCLLSLGWTKAQAAEPPRWWQVAPENWGH